MNATEYFKNFKGQGKKSPGSWLQLRDTKWLLEKLDQEAPKKKDGSWIFNDVLSEEYKRYLLTKEEENSTEDKTDNPSCWMKCLRAAFLEELNEEITQYLEVKFIERLTGLSKVALTKMGVDDVYEDLNEKSKLAYCSLMSAALLKFKYYSKRIDTHLMDEFLSELSMISDKQYSTHNKVIFENDKVKIQYDLRNRIQKVEK